jgi:hypothetical protein
MRKILATSVFVLLACSINVLAQSDSQEDLLKQIEAKRADLAVLENKILSPSAEDKAAFAEFLKQEDTGLIRLLPREKYGETPNRMTLTVPGGGAYYSFGRLTHAYGYGSDIELQQGYFSVGFAGYDYGVILNAGAVRLDEISLEHPSAFFLAAYKAAANEPQVRIEVRRFMSGETIDGIKYSNRVKAEVGMSYVLRSINYNKSDVLVALKVVRQDTDGSLIIAWKLLQKFPKPELARNLDAQ